MAIIVKETAGEQFAPAPEGVHQAVCIDVIDKGMITTEWNGTKREVAKIVIRWALEVEREDGQPFFVDQWYTASLSTKATLRQHLEMWRSKAFTPEELAGFDLEALVGVNCHLVVIHNHKDGRTYANVKGITPLGNSGMKMEIPATYVRARDRAQQNGGPQSHHKRPWEAERRPGWSSVLAPDPPSGLAVG